MLYALQQSNRFRLPSSPALNFYVSSAPQNGIQECLRQAHRRWKGRADQGAEGRRAAGCFDDPLTLCRCGGLRVSAVPTRGSVPAAGALPSAAWCGRGSARGGSLFWARTLCSSSSMLSRGGFLCGCFPASVPPSELLFGLVDRPPIGLQPPRLGGQHLPPFGPYVVGLGRRP